VKRDENAPREAPIRIRRYWLLTGAMVGTFLILFGVVEGLGVPLLTNPSAWLDRRGAVAAVVGVGLLVADVFLPVPSSVVMIAHGALFGVAWGAALSLAGSVGAAALGFAVGRRGTRALERLVSPAEKARADQLLARWGGLAIVATRPVPLLAETTAILAGASPMPWSRLLLASAAGSLPPALLYAVTGATSRNVGGGVLMFGIVLAISGGFWFLGKRAG
jgi:uncharacterized membrane protein YdjX (TVP38/TMEM64 family)